MRYAILIPAILVLAACTTDPSPAPDLVATQIAVEKAAHATMTAEAPAPPFVPEASTQLLFGGAATSLAGYVSLQIRARRRK